MQKFFSALSKKVVSSVVSPLYFHRAFAALQPTSQRLGAGGGYDTVHAGYKRSISHCIFRGATPPLAPNRQLPAGILRLYSKQFFNSVPIFSATL
jgi:hypothetical protein